MDDIGETSFGAFILYAPLSTEALQSLVIVILVFEARLDKKFSFAFCNYPFRRELN